jgi:hypothetical protein
MARKWLSMSILIAGLMGASATIASLSYDSHDQDPQDPSHSQYLDRAPKHRYRHQFDQPPAFERPPANFMVYCEMMGFKLSLMHPDTDQIIQASIADLAGEHDEWANSNCQHVWSPPDGKTLYVTIDGAVIEPDSNNHDHSHTGEKEEKTTEAPEKKKIPATLLVLKVNKISWEDEYIDLELVTSLTLGDEPKDRDFAFPEPHPDYPIIDWFPVYSQGHGPSFLPHSHYAYLTEWISNRIWVLDTRTNQWVEGWDPYQKEGAHFHGINFNHTGTLGLGTGYFYNLDKIEVYKANKRTGELKYKGAIKLADDEGYAPFTHYTFWLNHRYALTATMQVGPTGGEEDPYPIIGPSVWLLDTVKMTAERIIDPVDSSDGPGIFRPGSALGVAKNKLYVAEEDSLEGRHPLAARGEEGLAAMGFDEETIKDIMKGGKPDGYVSIFDISDVRHPKFIKRLSPGKELPADFAIGHELAVSPGEGIVYVNSFASGHIIKIDTERDEVIGAFSEEQGVKMPHGAFFPGNASESSFPRPPIKVGHHSEESHYGKW